MNSLPIGWSIKKLDKILYEKITGEWGEEADNDEGVKVLRTTNFSNNGSIKWENVVTRKVSPEIIQKKRLLYGDIILEKSGGSDSQPVGRVVFFDLDTKNDYICNNFTQVLRIDRNNAYPKYILYYLLNIHKKGITEYYQNKTTGIRNLQLKRYLEQDIPIPPLDQQKRIVSILEKAERAIQKRKEADELVEKYLQSVFIQMFGDPVVNPKGWEVKTAIEYADCIVPARDKPKSFSGSTPWITTDDLIHLGFTEKSKLDIALSHDEIKEVRARVIPKGSVIITCVGDLGIATIAKADMVVNQQLHTFQCYNIINNVFFMYAISFQKGFMYKRASKTTVPYMNKTTCNSIPMICPPIHLQNRFAQIVEKVEKLKQKQRQSVGELSTLFNSLMQKAFSGELTVDDAYFVDIPEFSIEGLKKLIKSEFKDREFTYEELILIISMQHENINYEEIKVALFVFLEKQKNENKPFLLQIFDKASEKVRYKIN